MEILFDKVTHLFAFNSGSVLTSDTKGTSLHKVFNFRNMHCKMLLIKLMKSKG
jgi:hypothetical protein